MNQRKAIPAKGTRLRLNRISVRRCGSDWSTTRLPSASAMRVITMAVSSSTPKRIPAMAAARRLRQKGRNSAGAGASVLISLRSSESDSGCPAITTVCGVVGSPMKATMVTR